MSEFRKAWRLEEGRKVHTESAAVTLAQAVPARDWVLRGSAPCLDSARGRVLLFVRRPEVDPPTLFDEPAVQVLDRVQVVAQGRGPDLADQRRGVEFGMAVHQLRREA